MNQEQAIAGSQFLADTAEERSISRPASWTWYALGCGLVFYAVVFLYLYPVTYSIYDEGGYLTLAATLREGKIHSAFSYPGAVQLDDGFLTKYNPGFAVLLVPFLFLHWKAAFMANFLLHLLGTLVFARLLAMFRLNPLYALLYLFYPTAVFWSHTLMADIAGQVLYLIGLLCFLRSWPFTEESRSRLRLLFSGACLGAAVSMRYANVLLVLPLACMAMIPLVRPTDTRRAAAWATLCFFSPLVLFAAAILYYHFCLGGSAAMATYGFHVVDLSVANILDKLKFYLLSLNLIYPLMLCALPFFCLRAQRVPRNVRILLAATVLLFAGFYATNDYHDVGRNPIESLIVGVRYLLPIAPILLLGYAFTLQEMEHKFPRFGVATVLLLSAVGAAGMLHGFRSHQAYLRQHQRMQQFVDTHLPENARIFGTMYSREFLAFPYLRQRESTWLVEGDRSDQVLDAALGRAHVYVLLSCKRTRDCGSQLEQQRRLLLGDSYSVEPVARFDQGWNAEILRIVRKEKARVAG